MSLNITKRQVFGKLGVLQLLNNNHVIPFVLKTIVSGGRKSPHGLRTGKKWYTQKHAGMETSLKRTLSGIAQLTRFDEYVYFVVIATLLGVAAARGPLDWRVLVLLLANWLAVGFAHMINDIEDAPDDAFSAKNQQRNPVSSGLITPRTAWIATLVIGLLTSVLFALVGFWTFVFGAANLILGLLFSLKTVRLKTIAFIDLVSYGLMLAGLPFLCGYAAHTTRLNRIWFWPFLFLMSIIILAERQDKLKDIERERREQDQHAVFRIGERAVSGLLIGLLLMGVVTGAVSFFLIDLIPAWVIVIMAIFVIIFVIPTWMKVRRDGMPGNSVQAALQKHVERAAAFALILQFLLPWLIQLFQ